jgi:transcription antitermination factor NusG
MQLQHSQPGAPELQEVASHTAAAWYPLQTRHQCEKKVDAALRDRGFEPFAPTQLAARRWSDRTKLVTAPLFPGYMFVRMVADPALLSIVVRLRGLVRFVTVGNELVAVTDAEMANVRALAANDEAYETGPFPAVGERVRIRGGYLEGIEGVLTGQTDRKEIVISVSAIQRSLKVSLGSYQVERLS